MKKEIILIGGGGHCKSCIDVIEQHNEYSIAGIVDLPENTGKKIFGYPIIACDNELENLAKRYKYFLITLGFVTPSDLRQELYVKIKKLGAHLPVIISPHAYVSKHSQIGEGTIVFHKAVINCDVKIGVNNILNTACLIEHDAVVGDHCHISTGSIVNGGVHIGHKTFFGSGAVSKQCSEIPENSFIKANSTLK